MTKRCFIMRGIPGGGKTTWVSNLEATEYRNGQRWRFCSADHFHFVNGVYEFKPNNLIPAHAQCWDNFDKATSKGWDVVVVDNTNLWVWELAPYYRVAEMRGYDATVVQMVTPFEVAAARQTHGVPPNRLWEAYQTFVSERLPPHWNKLTVVWQPPSQQVVVQL
jgi:hypothetical protein